MSIALKCDQCGTRYALKDELAGKAVKCRGCGKVLRAPSRPARSSTPRASASAPSPSRTAAPPELDLYGLYDDEPTPNSAGARNEGDVNFEEADDPPLPRGGGGRTPYGTRGESKDKGRPLARLSLGAVLSGGFALVWILVLVLRGGRLYVQVVRPLLYGPAATAPMDGTAPMPPMASTPPTGRPLETFGPGAASLSHFPDPGPGSVLEAGVRFHEVRLGEAGSSGPPGSGMRIWLYLPPGDHPPRSLPCVLIAPAGSNLVTGMDLGSGDQAEHLPYVRAGFAVLAYSLDGELRDPERPTVQDLAAASRVFLDARAGLENASLALQWLLGKAPQVDPARLYTAGHSSAGTMALLLAENEVRIKGCVAFAPRADTSRHGDPRLVAQLKLVIPHLDAFSTTYNPARRLGDLRCPLFLFHARDDSVIPVRESEQFAADLERQGKSVTLAIVPAGEHYDAMIQQGIPRAIDWLKRLDEAR